MHEDILKIVKEKLPSIHAEALGQYFEESKKIAVLLEIAQKEVALSRSNAKVLVADMTGLKNLITKHGDIDKREEQVLERERAAHLLQCRLDCETEKVALVKEMFKDVFRNSQIKRSIIGNTPVAAGEYGVALQSTSSDETVTQE